MSNNSLLTAFGNPKGERNHDVAVPHLALGDEVTVPTGFDKHEIELLPTLDGKMTVVSEEGVFSLAVELNKPSKLMYKFNPAGEIEDLSDDASAPEPSEVFMSAEIDGFVLRVDDDGVKGFGVKDGSEVDLFPDLDDALKETVLTDIAASMMLVDHFKQ